MEGETGLSQVVVGQDVVQQTGDTISSLADVAPFIDLCEGCKVFACLL